MEKILTSFNCLREDVGGTFEAKGQLLKEDKQKRQASKDDRKGHQCGWDLIYRSKIYCIVVSLLCTLFRYTLIYLFS